MSGGQREGRRQEVTVGEIRGGQIMTSRKTKLEQSRGGLTPPFVHLLGHCSDY